MFAQQHKVIGILGGMGPRATIDIYQQILDHTPAEIEQDHLSTLIYSNPKIPNRNHAFLTGDNAQIIDYLQQTAVALQRGGADVVVIPCNTAHIYYDEICQAVDIPVLHMIGQTATHIFKHCDYSRGVGLLSTGATFDSGLYQQFFDAQNVQMLRPESAQTEQIMALIFNNIKPGKDLEEAGLAIASIIEHWDVPVILGCTELPMVLGPHNCGQTLINPTEVLAKAAINFVLGE